MRAASRALAARSPVYYGWVIVVVGNLANLIAVGALLFAVTIYIPAIAKDFDVPRSSIVLAFSAGQIVSALVSPFAGRWIDHHGGRRAILPAPVPSVVPKSSRSACRACSAAPDAATFRRVAAPGAHRDRDR